MVEKATFRRHASYSALRGPAIALSTQLAAFVAIKSLGATERQAILLAFALPLGNLMAIFWSRMMVRRRRLPWAVWPDFVGFLLLFPIAFVVDPIWFIVLVFGTTLLRSSAIVALSGIIRDNYPGAVRAQTMGKVQAGALGAMAISGLVFGKILELDPSAYRFIYPFSAILGFIAVYRLSGVPESDPRERLFGREPSLLDIWHVLRSDRDFLYYQISFFIFGLAAMMLNALLPLYLAQDLQVDYVSGAIALVVITSGLPVLTSPIWGRMIDRNNVLVMRGLFNLVWALCPFIIVATHSVAGVYAGQILVGFIQGGSMLVWNLGVNIFARKVEVPTYMGIHQTLTGARGLIAPVLGLWLAYTFAAQGAEVPAYRTVFLLCGVLMLGAGIFMVWEGRAMEAKGRAVTFKLADERETA